MALPKFATSFLLQTPAANAGLAGQRWSGQALPLEHSPETKRKRRAALELCTACSGQAEPPHYCTAQQSPPTGKKQGTERQWDGHAKTSQPKPFCPTPQGSICFEPPQAAAVSSSSPPRPRHRLSHLESVQEELLEREEQFMSPENPGNTPVSQGTELLQEGWLQAQSNTAPLWRSLHMGKEAAGGQGDLGTGPGYPRALLQALGTRDSQVLPAQCPGQWKGLPAVGTCGTTPCTQAGKIS